MGKLDFGECGGGTSDPFTRVNLNGNEIGRATGQLSKTIEVHFKDCDILELKQVNAWGY